MRLSAHLGRIGEARGLSSLEMTYATDPGRWRRVEIAGVGDVLSEVAAPPDDVDEPETRGPVDVTGGRVQDVVFSSSDLALHTHLFETDGADTPDWMRIGSCQYQD